MLSELLTLLQSAWRVYIEKIKTLYSVKSCKSSKSPGMHWYDWLYF